MKIKRILVIAIPVILIAGIGYYFWRKRKRTLPGSKEKVKEGVLYVKK